MRYKEEPYCVHCEGNNILGDVYVEWDVINQEWVFDGEVGTKGQCTDCDCMTSFEWRKAE